MLDFPIRFPYINTIEGNEPDEKRRKKMISDKISKVQDAVAQFGFVASIASNDLIVVKNKKGKICANVTDNGVEQKYAGSKNLCGALVRNAIKAVIE